LISGGFYAFEYSTEIMRESEDSSNEFEVYIDDEVFDKIYF
jgi:hypothetical protein